MAQSNPKRDATVELYSAYGAKPHDPGLFCPPEEGMTKQSFKDECDVNVIMARFAETGQLPPPRRTPYWGDSIGITFTDAMDKLVEAQNAFEAMPAQIRNRFNNDPALFVEFCDNPENAPELVRMGLAEAKPLPQGADPLQTPAPATPAPATPGPTQAPKA